MKNYITLITISLFFIGIQSISAQNSNSSESNKSEYKTIFNAGQNKPSLSGYGALVMDFGTVSSNLGFNMGLDLAVLINKSFYIGIYERNLLSFPEYNFNYYNSDTNINIETTTRGFFAHGGIIIGGVIFPNKPLHLGLSTKIGVGAFGLFNTNQQHYDYNNNTNHQGSWFMGPLMIATPQLDLETNISYWLKLRLSVGYQWVSNSSLTYQEKDVNGQINDKTLLTSSDLSSPYLSLGLVFGWFK